VHRQERSNVGRVTGIAAAVLILVLLLAIYGSMPAPPSAAVAPAAAYAPPTPKPEPKPEPKQVHIRADVGTNGYVIAVKNLDLFDWTDVKIRLNFMHSGFFSIGYQMRKPVISAGASLTFELSEFYNSSGDRFDPLAKKPLDVLIECETPQGHGVMSAEWGH